MEYIGIVKSIKPIGYADVYNMEVENHHNFSVNGGFIVHNCRYGVLSRPPLSSLPAASLPADLPPDLRRDLERDPAALRHWLSQNPEYR